MIDRPRGTLRWLGLVVAMAAVGSLVCPAITSAQILIDNFSEVSDPGLYPIVREYPTALSYVTDAELSSTIGPARTIYPIAGPLGLYDPEADYSVTVNVDTALEQLTSVASADSTMWLILLWTGGDVDPIDANVSGFSELVINYDASTDFDLSINFSNTVTGTFDTSGSSDGFFTLPAATNSQFRIPLDQINQLVHIPLEPPDSYYPPVDLTSLDGITIQFQTLEVGATLTLDRLQFVVPEPATTVLLLLGLATLALRYRQRFREF